MQVRVPADERAQREQGHLLSTPPGRRRPDPEHSSTAEVEAQGNAARRRPGRPRLDTSHIVDEAVRFVDDHGAAALSMRSLAVHLGSSTATLYRHFPNRAALISALMDRVVGELDLDALEGPWRQWCEGFSTGWLEVMKRHRNVAVLMADQLPMGPNSMAAKERWLTVLLNNGFSSHLAAHSMAMLGHYVQGFAIQLSGDRAKSDRDEADYAAEGQLLDPARFPALSAAIAAGELPVPLESEFTFGLELILDSLERLRDRA